MKGSLIIVAFFVAGVILARWGVLPQELLQQDFSMYVLYGLMFLVGISIGSDRKAWAALKGQQLRIVLVPLATIVGTLAGSIGVSFLLTDIRLTDCLVRVSVIIPCRVFLSQNIEGRNWAQSL